MTPFDTKLRETLLDLLFQLRDTGIKLTLAGGYGLALKQEHLIASGMQSMLALIPQARATRDLDIFLRIDLLADNEQLPNVVMALGVLGFTPIPNKEYLQFVQKINPVGQETDIKVDLLSRNTGPHPNLKIDNKSRIPRIHPRPPIGLHTRITEEAITIEEAPLEYAVTGKRSNGEPFQDTVLLPDAFSYLMMKLKAFDDQHRRAQDETLSETGREYATSMARKHALDVYTIVAIMVEQEYSGAKALRQHYRNTGIVEQVATIVGACFSSMDAPGLIRLQQAGEWRQTLQVYESDGRTELEDLIAILGELFA